MKLNFDCFNEILRYIQENIKCNDTGLLTNLKFDVIVKNIPKYNKSDIYYCIRKLIESEYIRGSKEFNSSAYVGDITYKGHVYIQSGYKHPILSL